MTLPDGPLGGISLDDTRELVLDVLMEVLEKGAYSHQVIRDVLDKYNYSEGRDKAFVKEWQRAPWSG